MKKVSNYIALLLSITLAAAIGCRQDLGSEVSGVVTLDSNPLDHGSVAFFNTVGGPPASAAIQSDGTYVVRTASKAGLIPGDYVVTVLCRRADPAPKMTPAQLDALDITPSRYRSRQASGLKFTVKPGANQIDLPLTSD